MTDCPKLCGLLGRRRSGPKTGCVWSRPTNNDKYRSETYSHHIYENVENIMTESRFGRIMGGGFGLARSCITTEISDSDSEEMKERLSVLWIDYRIRQNGAMHRTGSYACMREADFSLVVRRGQPFELLLRFNQYFDQSSDKLSLKFSVADTKKSDSGDGSLAVVPVLANPKIDITWYSYIISIKRDEVLLRVVPPPDCIVAKWILEVDVTRKGYTTINFSHQHPIYIVFNPWCVEEEVYLQDEKEIDEYVMKEHGLMGRGTYDDPEMVSWRFGQFDQNVIEASFVLLREVGKLAISSCNDPVLVSRTFTQAVNAQDDNGAIMGNWTRNFEGGTAPTEWMGSSLILRKFLKERKPVKYGQCWVFAGVMTTVCRALGIPCRPVTAYCAAHDTNNSMTVDCTVDANGRPMSELNTDSIWNYHVWNEAWMARIDLKEMSPSWQVIDATPQETSAQLFRCGPASVNAVKHGDTRVPYDTGFVYAEVNADKVYWLDSGSIQPRKVLKWDTKAVGKLICTKQIGAMIMEDITENYKHPEDSKGERNVMLRALRQSSSDFASSYLKENFRDIKFELEITKDVNLGDNFSVTVIMTNTGIVDYTVKSVLTCEATNNTGRNKTPIGFHEEEKLVRHDRGQNKTRVTMHVLYKDYAKVARDENVFKITFFGDMIGTDYEYVKHDTVVLNKPQITFTLPDAISLGTTYLVSASFENTLPVKLNKGVFYITGPSAEEQQKIKLRRPVNQWGTAECSFNIKADKLGPAQVSAIFKSDELRDIRGYQMIKVKRNAEGFDQ